MEHLSRRALAGFLLTPALRTLGQGCAPPTGVAQNFTPLPGLQSLPRKAISALTAAEATRLRLAYKRLRDLTVSDPTDPRGWMQQANVHCWQCGGSGTDVHQSWFFLPWHRAYLYFHERILIKLLNDTSFRLPFWDWDATVSRNLPAIHRPANVGATPNSLFDANRSPTASGGSAIPASTFLPNPMSAPNFTAFGGNAASGGTIENGPHGRIHVWAGDPSTGLDMGRLDTAARDPIFYAHHCNIDRLWAEWFRRNPLAHAHPTAASFRNKTYLFFDQEKVLRRIRVSQVLNTAPLGFSYPAGAALARPAEPRFTELSLDTDTKSVSLTDDLRTALRATNALVVRRSLVVEDVVLPAKTGLYNVFAGDPPAAGADQASAPNYLGYIAVILGDHPHQRRSTMVFTPSKEFFDRAENGTVLTIAEAGSTEGTRLEYGDVYLSED